MSSRWRADSRRGWRRGWRRRPGGRCSRRRSRRCRTRWRRGFTSGKSGSLRSCRNRARAAVALVGGRGGRRWLGDAGVRRDRRAATRPAVDGVRVRARGRCAERSHPRPDAVAGLAGRGQRDRVVGRALRPALDRVGGRWRRASRSVDHAEPRPADRRGRRDAGGDLRRYPAPPRPARRQHAADRRRCGGGRLAARAGRSGLARCALLRAERGDGGRARSRSR